MTTVFIPLLLGSLLAGFIQGLSGFGFAVVAMSYWAWFLEPKTAAILTLYGGLLGQTISALKVRTGFVIKLVGPFIFGGLVGIPIGSTLLPYLDITLFKRLLGIFLLIWCPLMLFAHIIPPVQIRYKVVNLLVGLCGGIMSGFGGFAGVLPTLWCTLNSYEKETQRAIIQNFSLSILWATMIVYIYQGLINSSHIKLFAIMTPAVLISSIIGAKLFYKISPSSFRKIVLTVLMFSGLALTIGS